MSSNDLLHLSRRQRAGIFALIILIVLVFLCYRIYHAEKKPEQVSLSEKEQQAWSEYSEKRLTADDRQDYRGGYKSQGYNRTDKFETTVTDRTFFDPNTASKERLIAAGLPESVAGTLIKFRNSGARFHKVEDLKKVYGLRDKYYKQIVPYIKIDRPEKTGYVHYSKNNSNSETNVIIDVNTATPEALIRLKGIGPAYANRIINYRDKLGGFIKAEQLKEVYGLPDSTYQQLIQLVKIDAQRVKRMNVNMASEEQLTNHPYIKKNLASGIIKLRNDLKVFNKIEDLRQVPLINEEKYRKIAPYLTVE